MLKMELKSTEYIKIKQNSTNSYGGSQMWFNAGEKGRENVIAGYGCGVVAAADLILYLAKAENEYITDLTRKMAADSEIDMAEYLEYLKSIERSYGHVLNHIGMTGFSLAAALNRYFRKNELCLKAVWKNMALNSKTAICDIKQMLDRDIPVIISIPGVFVRSRALHMYRSEQTSVSAEKERAYKYASFSGHYVTVTGILENDRGDEILVISSWGKKYYMELCEYERSVKTLHGVLACGMVKVTEISNPQRPIGIKIKLN
ncbi:MAG: hypothetical protein RSA97_00765 [Oscillospiraceae bacterium]